MVGSNKSNTCPCGSSQNLQLCCGQYIYHGHQPPTAEALMRSRYTAYTLAEIDYIEQTMRGAAAKDFDPQSAKQWARAVCWLGLSIVQSQHSTVTFLAKYSIDGQLHTIYETSQFDMHDGAWVYLSGKTPSLSRNAACPCGSGLKSKRCCFSTSH